MIFTDYARFRNPEQAVHPTITLCGLFFAGHPPTSTLEAAFPPKDSMQQNEFTFYRIRFLLIPQLTSISQHTC